MLVQKYSASRDGKPKEKPLQKSYHERFIYGYITAYIMLRQKQRNEA